MATGVFEMGRFALRASQKDNVATTLADVSAGQSVIIRGAGEIQTVVAKSGLPLGHKIAIHQIKLGEDIIKFGLAIGRATRDIQAGFWVHTHNMASKLETELRESHMREY